MNISIIGAGPIGCYTGYLLAKHGHNVNIYEEHSKIGHPVQCTGIITKSIERILPLHPSFTINKIKKAEIISPNNKSLTLNSTDIIIDRTKFDQFLAKKAKAAGAKIHTSHLFLDYSKKTIKIKHKNKKITKTTDILIGADGPNSKVRKLITKRTPKFYVGKQALVKGKFNKDTYKVFFGKQFPNFFGWIVPESKNKSRIGLITQKNTSFHFKNFLERLKIKNSQIISYQAGLIPIHNPKSKIHKRNIFLVGDAALQIKATTGGGIVPGLQSAQILAKCITKNKNYTKELKKINKKLSLHLKLHKIRKKFTDKDYNHLIALMSKPKNQEILSKYTRDNVNKLILKLLINEPRLLLYAYKLL